MDRYTEMQQGIELLYPDAVNSVRQRRQARQTSASSSSGQASGSSDMPVVTNRQASPSAERRTLLDSAGLEQIQTGVIDSIKELLGRVKDLEDENKMLRSRVTDKHLTAGTGEDEINVGAPRDETLDDDSEVRMTPVEQQLADVRQQLVDVRQQLADEKVHTWNARGEWLWRYSILAQTFRGLKKCCEGLQESVERMADINHRTFSVLKEVKKRDDEYIKELEADLDMPPCPSAT